MDKPLKLGKKIRWTNTDKKNPTKKGEYLCHCGVSHTEWIAYWDGKHWFEKKDDCEKGFSKIIFGSVGRVGDKWATLPPKKTKSIPTMTIICVWEVLDGVSQTPTAFYGNNEKKVVKAAEKHFRALMKENGYTDKNTIQESLDNGNFDNGFVAGNGAYEVNLSWPTREEIK